jgi:hypothetical protein
MFIELTAYKHMPHLRLKCTGVLKSFKSGWSRLSIGDLAMNIAKTAALMTLRPPAGSRPFIALLMHVMQSVLTDS